MKNCFCNTTASAASLAHWQRPRLYHRLCRVFPLLAKAPSFFPPLRRGGRGGGAWAIDTELRECRLLIVPPALNAFARSWEGEPPGEPRQHPARTEPRPPGITQGRFAPWWSNSKTRSQPALCGPHPP